MTKEADAYSNIVGYPPSILRLLSWRTASNSCAYLIPHLQPHYHILDVGCGPGSITLDLAALVPNGKVVGLDIEAASAALDLARAATADLGVNNAEWVVGDALKLDYPDHTFDVVCGVYPWTFC